MKRLNIIFFFSDDMKKLAKLQYAAACTILDTQSFQNSLYPSTISLLVHKQPLSIAQVQGTTASHSHNTISTHNHSATAFQLSLLREKMRYWVGDEIDLH